MVDTNRPYRVDREDRQRTEKGQRTSYSKGHPMQVTLSVNCESVERPREHPSYKHTSTNIPKTR